MATLWRDRQMRITEHVHAVRVPFQVPLTPDVTLERFVYAFAILGKQVCLVDSGVAGADRLIFDAVRHAGRSAGDIARLILTHSHPDHIGAARAIQQVTGCQIAAHQAEKAWIEDVGLQDRQRPVPGFALLVGGSVKMDRELADGETVEIGGGLTLEVLHTPGHSAGSISLLLRPDNVLFCGDAIPLPGDLPIWEDYPAQVRSVERLRAVEQVDVLLSAWDVPREGEAIHHTMDQSLQHLSHVRAAVEEVVRQGTPVTPMALCRQVVATIGLPPVAANPLVARSFAACARTIQ